MTPPHSFRKRLRMIRELRGLNQTQLASKGGMPPSSIAHFEGGSRKPSFDNIGLLADALDVSADYLLGRTDDPAFSRTADRRRQQISHLSASDRELNDDFIAMLFERNRRKKQKESELQRDMRFRHVEEMAEEALSKGKITSLPVPVLELVHMYNFGYISVSGLDARVSGMLQRAGELTVISYDVREKREGFGNFGIAHELGHILLEGHKKHLFPTDGVHASQAGFLSADPFEREADHFASRLLMPADLLRDKLADLNIPGGLKKIEAISSLCRTSLTSAAIRYAELTEDSVAVIISGGMSVDFCCLSRKMKSLDGVNGLKRGAEIPADSETTRAYTDIGRFDGARYLNETANLIAWLGGDQPHPIREEVTGVSYGRVLTVLTCSSIK